MQLIHPGPDEAALCLRAVRSVVVRDGVIPPAARSLMEAAKQLVLSIDVDITLALITPTELAAGLHTPGLADQVVQAMIVGVLSDGDPDPECFARVEAFAAALGVSVPALRTVRLLCEHHLVLFRLDFLRHSHIKDAFVDQYKYHGGLRGLAEGCSACGVCARTRNWHGATLRLAIWRPTRLATPSSSTTEITALPFRARSSVFRRAASITILRMSSPVTARPRLRR